MSEWGWKCLASALVELYQDHHGTWQERRAALLAAMEAADALPALSELVAWFGGDTSLIDD